eukprot:CAMPEP_0201581718 /NCGR_PEP_ID=MMETSP0190_2-20130828/74330_1 /ASSEMBLY_ACC=CAM_ASM_000263 /TAXON_ID=37353 /ORGANISM="Rosalina sp." /LENGTH=138 /DNA_ID=CAMNT_0048020293 /DNA_START=191 /DNA_END=607 /DNA_ORIENTATION=+
MADSSLSNISNISNIDDDEVMDEIKEEEDISDSKADEMTDSSSSSEYNSDFTPSVDQNEDLKDFHISEEYEKENNNQYHKSIKSKQKRVSAKLSKLDFFDSLQAIPDTLTNTIDDFMSIFDKTKKSKKKKPSPITIST